MLHLAAGIPRSITGSGVFRRFSKIGNEPIPVLDAAKIGNDIKSLMRYETVSVMSQYRFSTQPKSVMAEPVMGTQLKEPVVGTTRTGYYVDLLSICCR